MTTWINDTLTEGSTTPLTSHTAETGGTWVNVIGASSPDIFSTLGGVVGGPASATLYRNTVLPSTADVTMQAGFYYDSVNFSSVGIACRLNSAGTAGYLCIHRVASTNWEVYRLGAGQSTTLVAASAGGHTYTSGATPAITAFSVTGSGASIAIVVDVNGSNVITTTDTHAERATAAGYAGLWSNRIGFAANSGMFVGAISGVDSAASTTVTYTTPIAGQICPLSGAAGTGTATISVSGTYTGTAPNQWRLVLDGGSTSVSGFDWASFSSAPAAGAFSQTIASVPKLNGWYNVQVRDSVVPATTYATGKVAPGVHFLITGQSPATLFFSAIAYAGDSSLTPDALLRITGKQPANAWLVPATATMNAAIACGNDLVASFACPVALIDGAWDGSGLTVTGNGGQWVPTSNDPYQESKTAVTAAGGKILGEAFLQGEADAGSGVGQSTYYTALGTLFAQRRSDLSAASLPIVLVTLARNTAGMSDASREAIKLAQVQKCADSNMYRVDRLDLALHTDGVHNIASGQTQVGKRVARAFLAANGIVAQYRGPSIASVVRVSGAVFDVNLTHHNGTDFTPTSAITGLRFTDPGAADAVIAVTTAVRQSSTAIRCTLASTPVSLPNVDHLYGSTPTITGITVDNSALTLPLEYIRGVAATSSRPLFQKSLLTGIGSGGSFFQNPLG